MMPLVPAAASHLDVREPIATALPIEACCAAERAPAPAPPICRSPVEITLRLSQAGETLFRDNRQRAAALRKLLVLRKIEALWSSTGPTGRAYMLLDEDDGSLSTDERRLLLLCFDLWRSQGGALSREASSVLDGEIVEALSSLLLALEAGRAAVDDWIAAMPSASPRG